MPRSRAKSPARCAYREGNRRCPYDRAEGSDFCRPHGLAIEQASKPRQPGRVILDSVGDWLQGKPINREATIGAVEALFGTWSGVMGSEYRPEIVNGASEDSVHRRAQSGTGRPWQWNIPHAQHPGAPPPPPPDPHHEDRLRVMLARKVMGFGKNEPLDRDKIRIRHRELLKKHHPDHHGGSHERMANINTARDILLACMESA